MSFNEHELLTHSGKVKAEIAKSIAEERYDEFDKIRKREDALAADNTDIIELEQIEKALKNKNKGK